MKTTGEINGGGVGFDELPYRPVDGDISTETIIEGFGLIDPTDV